MRKKTVIERTSPFHLAFLPPAGFLLMVRIPARIKPILNVGRVSRRSKIAPATTDQGSAYGRLWHLAFFDLLPVHLYVARQEPGVLMGSYFRFRLATVQRSKGASALRRVAYQSCQRMVAPDGHVFDYSKNRESHGHIETIISAPAASPDWVNDPQKLWSKAVIAERRADAQEARTMEVSIPRGLPRELWGALAREIVAGYVAMGMVAQIDIHLIAAADGGLNPHLHILLTMRRIVGDGFGAKKAREWNSFFYPNAKKLRAEIARTQNEFCERHGVPFHADPRPNFERKLPPPEPVLPRWNFIAAQRTGERTPWLQRRDAEKKARNHIKELEASLAALTAEIEQAEKDNARKWQAPLRPKQAASSAEHGLAGAMPDRMHPADVPRETVRGDRLHQHLVRQIQDDPPARLHREPPRKIKAKPIRRQPDLQPPADEAGQSSDWDADAEELTGASPGLRP